MPPKSKHRPHFIREWMRTFPAWVKGNVIGHQGGMGRLLNCFKFSSLLAEASEGSGRASINLNIFFINNSHFSSYLILTIMQFSRWVNCDYSHFADVDPKEYSFSFLMGLVVTFW